MKEVIIIIQIILAIFLIGAILLQTRGTGLGSAWGGGGEFYRSRRGIEKVLLKTTVVLAIIFFVLLIFSLTT